MQAPGGRTGGPRREGWMGGVVGDAEDCPSLPKSLMEPYGGRKGGREGGGEEGRQGEPREGLFLGFIINVDKFHHQWLMMGPTIKFLDAFQDVFGEILGGF